MAEQTQALTGPELVERVKEAITNCDSGVGNPLVRMAETAVLTTLDAIRQPSEVMIGDITPWHQARDRTRETIRRYVDALKREIAG